jgi:LmbE family N-acetylglucosaminyl deacetylase
MQERKPNPRPKSVLIVAAHPDDCEFMAGGILSHWQSLGASIHFLLVTDGVSGSRDPNQTQEQLAEIRREEQRAAARVLGSEDVTFLGYPDGKVEPTLELRWDIARVIRRVRPEVLITTDPLFRYNEEYINHPDHRAVADATLAAIMPTANTLLAALDLLDEGLEPHDVQEVYLSGAVNPTVWIPITEADLERQSEALRQHKSQLGDWDPLPRLKEGAAKVAEEARARGIECEYANCFYFIYMRRYDVEELVEEVTAEPAEDQGSA